MNRNSENTFRRPSEEESALLQRLLMADFPGKPELALLLDDVIVRRIDEDGGLELKSLVDGSAPVTHRIPVEAEAKDEDGVVIHMLLHVVDGKPVELEFFREDASTVKKIPSPNEFSLIVLPAPPPKGWLDY
jgi:hypothetical protein